MEKEREEQRELVRRMLAYADMSPSTLARTAGLSPSTLTRFLNKPVDTLLSGRTLAKLAEASGYQSAGGPFLMFRPGLRREQLNAIGRRMSYVRAAMAPNRTDAEISGVLGWPVERLTEMFKGNIEPSVFDLGQFARRMRVTTDFLLFGRLDGLERKTERRLLDIAPQLLEDNDGNTDTDPVENKTDQGH